MKRKRAKFYILNKRGEPVPSELFAAAKWFEESGDAKVVCKTRIGRSTVSTVFLWFDHGMGYDEVPILWETMVFSDDKSLDGIQERCGGSREQAEAMHERVVKQVKIQKARH